LPKVHLHGYLSRFHDGPIEVAAPTVAHAIEVISRIIPGLAPNAVKGRHKVVVSGCSSKEDFYVPFTGTDIHIFPQLSGGKQAGLLQILIGGLLIGASFLIPGGFLATALFSGGIALVAGGLIQMLTPQPKDTAESRSKYLGAPKNTVAIGTYIPILYGKHRAYGQFLSFEVFSKIVKVG
jgi:predicted phage tail protein